MVNNPERIHFEKSELSRMLHPQLWALSFGLSGLSSQLQHQLAMRYLKILYDCLKMLWEMFHILSTLCGHVLCFALNATFSNLVKPCRVSRYCQIISHNHHVIENLEEFNEIFEIFHWVQSRGFLWHFYCMGQTQITCDGLNSLSAFPFRVLLTSWHCIHIG